MGKKLSSQKIKEVALQLFATRGYEGTSLADIAELVGIKKSSIYNHYKNKDDLFLHIFEKSCAEELAFRKKVIENRKNGETISLEQFVESTRNQVINNFASLFVFRFTAFPPHHFKNELKDKINRFFEDLHTTIKNGMRLYPEYASISEEQLVLLSSHYILLLKGTFVDLLNHQFMDGSPLTAPAWTRFYESDLNK